MDQTTERPTTRLRRLLQGPEILMAPGCFDPVSALLAEQAGFSALYLTGTGLASHVVGVDERVDWFLGFVVKKGLIRTKAGDDPAPGP